MVHCELRERESQMKLIGSKHMMEKFLYPRTAQLARYSMNDVDMYENCWLAEVCYSVVLRLSPPLNVMGGNLRFYR